MQIFGMEGVSTHMTIAMSPLLNNILGESLTYMGITHPAQSTDLFSMSDDQEVLMTNKAVDLVGYVFPRTKDKPASYNKVGQTLDHPAFWDNHLQWRQKPNGGKMLGLGLGLGLGLRGMGIVPVIVPVPLPLPVPVLWSLPVPVQGQVPLTGPLPMSWLLSLPVPGPLQVLWPLLWKYGQG